MRRLTDSFIQLSDKAQDRVNIGKIETSDSYLLSLLSRANTSSNAPALPLYFAFFDDAVAHVVHDSFDQSLAQTDEKYAIVIEPTKITVYADTQRARVYAAHALLDHAGTDLAHGVIYAFPRCPHRSVHVFFPPHDAYGYFLRFIDMLCAFGYNKLILQVSGAMEFKRRKEINDCWKEYAKSYLEYNGKTYDNQISTRIRNANHSYNAHGEVYTQKECRDLAAYCEARGIEIIPEVPYLSHSEYLLAAHPELAECPDEWTPDTCCPLHPDLYKYVFDLFDEVIDVFHPQTLHIGHDEWWVMCQCERCRGKDPAQLFANDVNHAYQYLKEKGVKTMIWGDKLMKVCDRNGEFHGGAHKKIWSVKTDRSIEVMGKECPIYEKYWFKAPENIEEMGGIPHELLATYDCAAYLHRDIQVLNWYWAENDEINDVFLRMGYPMAYGNCNCTNLEHWEQRLALGAQGISISCWLQMDEVHFQRWDTAMFQLGYGAMMTWREDYSEKAQDFLANVLQVAHAMFRQRNAETLQVPHLRITHTALTTAENADNIRPYIVYDDVGLGTYEIHYTDGTITRQDVLFGHNIGYKYARTDRWHHPVLYWYQTDPFLTMPAGVCDLHINADGAWYTLVLPLDVHKTVQSVQFVPREKYRTKTQIAEICVMDENDTIIQTFDARTITQ